MQSDQWLYDGSIFGEAERVPLTRNVNVTAKAWQESGEQCTRKPCLVISSHELRAEEARKVACIKVTGSIIEHGNRSTVCLISYGMELGRDLERSMNEDAERSADR